MTEKVSKQPTHHVRKSVPEKPHVVHSEPKICCKRRIDFGENVNMIPAGGDIGRMQHGFSQLNLATPIPYPVSTFLLINILFKL